MNVKQTPLAFLLVPTNSCRAIFRPGVRIKEDFGLLAHFIAMLVQNMLVLQAGVPPGEPEIATSEWRRKSANNHGPKGV